MTILVCPDCGCTEFQQDRPAVLRFTMTAERFGDSNVIWCDTDEETVDADRDDEITCTDCSRELSDDELVTEEEYSL